MKKVLVLFLCLMLFLLGGCWGNVAEDSFLSVLPWTPDGVVSAIGEETCEYSITRFKGGTDGTVVTKPESNLIYSVKEGFGLDLSMGSAAIVEQQATTLLTAQLSIFYLNTDDVDELYRGKTELITAYCVFGRYDMQPRLAYRNVDSITSYTLTTNYTQKKATLKDADGEATLPIKSSGYDNESLYYLVRAQAGVKLGGSTKLPLVVAYDDFKHQKSSVKSREIIQATSAEPVDIEVSPSVYRQFFEGTSDTNQLACLQTLVALNDSKSGPATKLYFAQQKTRVASADINSVSYEAKNVLIKIETQLHGYMSGSLALDYTTVYQLANYTNK